MENGMGGAEQSVNGRCRLQRLESGNETENENEDNENNENDEEREGEDDSGGPLVPFKIPGTAPRIWKGDRWPSVFLCSCCTRCLLCVLVQLERVTK